MITDRLNGIIIAILLLGALRENACTCLIEQCQIVVVIAGAVLIMPLQDRYNVTTSAEQRNDYDLTLLNQAGISVLAQSTEEQISNDESPLSGQYHSSTNATQRVAFN